MAFVLFLLFLVVPVVELWVIVNVAGSLGVLPTIGLLVLVSVAGAWLVRREGLGVLRRLSATTGRGELPTDELLDGALLLVAGLLLMTPGFLSDALGVALLLPPVRAVVRRGLVSRFRRRLLAGLGGMGVPSGAAGPGSANGFAWSARTTRRVDVGRAWIDADAHEGGSPRGSVGPGGGSAP